MTGRVAGADLRAAVAVSAAAAVIAVLPPIPRLIAAGMVLGIPLLAWMAGSPTAWVGTFVAAVLVLPPLPLSMGTSGAHPAVAIAGIGLLAGIGRSNSWILRREPIGSCLAALTMAMLASVAMALIYSGVEVALGSAVRVMLFACTPWLFLYVSRGPGRVVAERRFTYARLLFACGAASALFACVDFFFQFPAPAGYSPQFIWMDDRVLRRAQGLFYDAGALGNICSFFLVMAAVCIVVRGRAAINGWLAAAGALPLAAALVLSYSRAALLNLAAALVALLIVRRRDLKCVQLTLVLPAAVAAIAGIGFAAAPAYAHSWAMRLDRTVQLAFAATDMALSGRLSTWDTISSFIVQHPLRVLFGVGYKTLAWSDVLGRPVIADNTWISVLVETGIAGVVALAVLNGAILRATFRAARSGNPSTAFYGTWAFCFWIGEMVQMFTADLLTWWRVLPVIFFVIALAVAGVREETA